MSGELLTVYSVGEALRYRQGGGVCDVPGERCNHPISCAQRGCIKRDQPTRTKPTPDV